ncbi:MAG: geranylgeranyl reductase family protein, partial [Candidatus Aenigmatarchaeota archaeon]
ILERKQFDKWMAKRAARAGADVYSHTKITGLLENNKGVKGIRDGEEFEEESEMVVAADGVESLVAIEAGIKQPSNIKLVDSGFQYEMTDLDLEHPEKIVLYLGNDIAPRGYVWIFPKGDDTANVGIGILGDEEKTAKHYLDRFIEDRPELNKGSIIEVNSGGIPVGGFLDDMTEDNCLAVGDAANQVNPIHGGGMAESIKASRIAGDVITDAIEEGDTSKQNLQDYNERWWKERGKSLRKVEKVREVMENLSDDDLNFLAKELEGDDLTSLSHGNALKKLGRILLKRPSLVKLGRKLI